MKSREVPRPKQFKKAPMRALAGSMAERSSWLALGLGLLTLVGPWGTATAATVAESGTRAAWTHPRCQQLPTDRDGPFVILGNGRLLTVEGNAAHFSGDEGRTWEQKGPVLEDRDPGISREWRVLHRTRSGAIVLVFMDLSRRKWGWDNQTNEPEAGVFNEVWSLRSLDEGQTWGDAQLLSRDYCGALVDILETRSGRVVVPVMKLLRQPARHSFVNYFSDDGGKTWAQSNLIDLGGHGHHDGAIEPTLVELEDGRLWTLIRTNWDRFWEAFSEDEGRSWRIIRPSQIDASSAPGHLVRLASGRLMLAWNRLYPEGVTGDEWNRRPRARRGLPYSRIPGSWQREELSVSFSQDDGQTWTNPLVVARQPQGWLSYPYLFERRPGEIWLTTHYAGTHSGEKRQIITGARLKLLESDFADGVPR